MLDAQLFRKQPETVRAAFARRGLSDPMPAFEALDVLRAQSQSALEALERERNVLSQEIGRTKGALKKAEGQPQSSPALDALMQKAHEVNAKIDAQKAEAEAKMLAVQEFLAALPNLAAEDTPLGSDDTQNVTLRECGTVRQHAFAAKDHADLGEALGGLDFELGAKLAGTRFAVLGGGVARLHRALGQFMLDTHIAHGYREMQTPVLVRPQALRGTGQLPKFAEDLFVLERDNLSLIPTAEVTLTNLVADSILDEDALPIKLTALTQCFRREAGSAGRDTRGLIRQHQFEKVELVRIERPEHSEEALEAMCADAERILEGLELAWRARRLCGGDMGFSAAKTIDLEVWLPSQQTYREISSCSNCGDFQSRRALIRTRKGAQKTRLPHTLNGSGLAVGRALVAVLDTHQQADGSVSIPAALRPYMGGLDKLVPERDWRLPKCND